MNQDDEVLLKAVRAARRRPWADWRVPAAAAVAMLTAAVLVAVLALLSERRDLRSEVEQLREGLGEQNDRSACRARLAAALSDAQVERDLADDAVTIAIGAEAGVAFPPSVEVLTIEQAARELASAEAQLRRARDARLEFEDDTDSGCPEP